MTRDAEIARIWEDWFTGKYARIGDALNAAYDAALLADTPSVEPDVGRVRLTMIDGIGVELSREFAQGSPFEPFDRIYVLKTITRILDAARDRTRKAKRP